MYIVGDNGPSAEGGLEGTFNEVASLVGFNPGLASIVKRIDQIGGPESRAACPGRLGVGDGHAVSVDQAGGQPLRRHPQPDDRSLAQGDQGEGRDPHPVPPRHRRGADHPRCVQGPRAEGRQRHSAEADRRRVDAATPSTTPSAKSKRTTQYFEMFVNRAIYHDGWLACSRFGVPWSLAGKEGDFLKAPWELYNLDADFSQADDLAAKNPEKLKELQALFLEEAKKYDVFPLDPRLGERLDSRNRIAGEPRTSWTYYGNNVRLPEPIGPIVYPNSHTITAELTVPENGLRGRDRVRRRRLRRLELVRQGRQARRTTTTSPTSSSTTSTPRMPLPSGKVTLRLEYASKGTPKGSTISDGAVVKLFVNGKLAAEGETKKAMFRHGVEPFEVGRDSISPVNADYKAKMPFAFTGTIEKITFEVTPMKVSAANMEQRAAVLGISRRSMMAMTCCSVPAMPLPITNPAAVEQ